MRMKFLLGAALAATIVACGGAGGDAGDGSSALGAKAGYSFSTLDYPGATTTALQGVDNRGEAVGFYSDSTGNSHGFREFHGAFTSFDVPGALGTAPRAVNS